ncbi:MAG: lipoxygenase family protein [Nostoc sp. ChiSLP02]|nr:lipoxygenase family protein [Nostoc sp. DedSLP05]MDZ8097107.1 lipoxygenase family protein [Nostoc sp. DedSLP01]MDZ8189981.1 lipoxygenase family protein [Nostoc sp. ChiSLP02]
MSLASHVISSSLGLSKGDLQSLLVLLYKLVKLSKASLQYMQYEYNYSYIPPLAMTGALPLPAIKIELPIQELPNLKWVLAVAQKITLILVNDTVSNFSGFFGGAISFSLGDDTENNTSVLDNKVQALKDIEQKIKDADSYYDLEQIALTIASITQDITDEIVAADPSNVVSFDAAEVSEFEEKLQAIDEQFELLEFNNESGNVEFLSSFSLEDSLTDLLSNAFKQIINSDAKLLELENNQPLDIDVDFSTGTSPMNPSIEDYNKLFTKIPLPEISSRFREDLVFAYMQVAGPNPLMLQQVLDREKTLEINQEQYQKIIGIPNDSLEAAIREGRLYKADYSKLKNMKNGSFPNQQKYIYAPLALFVVPPASNPSRSLVPLAIQCQSERAVFTPLDGENWMVAKSIVQMADSNYHEIVSHLGRTHLFIEPFVIATKRRLPANHHLRILLEPHFEGTILINYGAHKLLVADRRQVDELLASTIESDRELTVEAAQDYLHHFNDAMFPNILASRRVNNKEQLPEYPYRDDGLLIWNAIHQWVSAYLSSYYTNSQQLLADQALQNWAKELISEQGGRLQNFGEDASGAIKTLDYLIDAVCTIIFTASAQHAAVNFAQGELMTYTPAFPLASYSPAPTSLDEEASFMSMLPSIEQARTQLKVTYLLGSVYYTQLGQYSNSYFKSKPQISSALQTFQNQLKAIEKEITQRNCKRIMPYKFLLPSQIPQSINI